MKITVAGFWGGYPAADGATSGYLFEHEGFSLLVDCGSAVLSKVQKYIDITELDAVIISHYHHDHIADVGPLHFARLVNSYLKTDMKPLTIYGHTLDEEGYKKLNMEPYVVSKPYRLDELLEIGPFQISFIKTEHPVPCAAMRITCGGKTVVYTADTSFFEGLIPFAEQADLLVCECNFYGDQDGKDAGHMNTQDAGRLAESAGVKELWLTHLPQYGSLSELCEQAGSIYKGPVALAETGRSWEK